MEYSGRSIAKVSYVLGIVGQFLPICMFVGVIISYFGRSRTDNWMVESHLDYFIKYFWIWLVFCVVMIFFFLIGAVILFFLMEIGLVIFFIVKFCLGFSALSQGEPIE